MTSPDLLACIRNGRDLTRLKARPLRFAVPGVFPEGFSVLAGAPKRGKSWLALDVCLAVASGGRALGAIDVAPGRAFYIALEDSERRLQSRARHLLGDREPIPERFDYLTDLDQPARFVELLTAYCRQHPDARLIVVDTLTRVRPSQPRHKGAYEWDYAVGAALKRVADEHGVALVAVTHTRQMAATDFVEAVSGTSGLTGAADTIVVLDRARGQDDAMLKVTGRDVDEREYAMRMAGGTWHLLDRAPVEPSLSDRTVAILDYVSQHPEGVRAADVAQALSLDLAATRVYLTRLADAERIGRSERGVYIPQHPPVTSVAGCYVLSPQHTHNATDRETAGERSHRRHPRAGRAVTVHRCAEPGCPYLVRWVDRCPAHRTRTTPDRMPSRDDLERATRSEQ